MSDRPNIILINCDDLGYGDLGCYGSQLNRTPALDQMADEGMRFTDFYMVSPVCSPSRGGMLTGCYPNRIGFDEFENIPVLFPGQAVGLSDKEETMATVLKRAGYATKIVGKWHCGDQPEFMPTRHGFDSWYGLPYSNDMGRQDVDRKDFIKRLHDQHGVNYVTTEGEPDTEYPPLPLMSDEKVVEEQPDQGALTDAYMQECMSYIKENKDGPFFLYLAHMYVHLPIYTPKSYLDNSQNGSYGAAVEHVDATTKQILDCLKECGIDDNTLVVFTSDNGSRGQDGGSNAPLRGAKFTTYEGGQRLPCIMRWPARIKAGSSCSAVCASMDFLSTFADLAGVTPQQEQPIDGKSMTPLIDGGQESPHDVFVYYHFGTLEAIRDEEWKLHISRDGKELKELYNLRSDIGEQENVFDQNPEVVERLTAIAADYQQRLGDRRLGITGSECRPKGRVERADTLTHFDPHHPYAIAEYDLPHGG